MPSKKTAQDQIALRETDLYHPLKQWLVKAGYAVHGEVGACDLAAQKGQELVLIELKLSINLELLLQLMRRQTAEALVYAAVPAPKNFNQRWKELMRLVKRLEAGLIIIHPQNGLVDLVFHPSPPQRRCRKANTAAFLKEIQGRAEDFNLGGSCRQKIMTAYRQEALRIAAQLAQVPSAAPKDLRALGTSERTGSILRSNHYHWFEKLARGSYGLSPLGHQALDEYAEQVKIILNYPSKR